MTGTWGEVGLTWGRARIQLLYIMTTIPSGEMFEIIAAVRPYLHLSTQKSLCYAIRDLGWSRRNLYEHHSMMPPVSVRNRVWHTSTGVTAIVTVHSDTVHHDCALTVTVWVEEAFRAVLPSVLVTVGSSSQPDYDMTSQITNLLEVVSGKEWFRERCCTITWRISDVLRSSNWIMQVRDFKNILYTAL